MSGCRLVVLPASELEPGGLPFGVCHRCGISARVEPCHPSVYPATRAATVACDDVVACERRRYWRSLGVPA